MMITCIVDKNVSLFKLWGPRVSWDDTFDLTMKFPCLHRPGLQVFQVILDGRLPVVFLEPARAGANSTRWANESGLGKWCTTYFYLSL